MWRVKAKGAPERLERDTFYPLIEDKVFESLSARVKVRRDKKRKLEILNSVVVKLNSLPVIGGSLASIVRLNRVFGNLSGSPPNFSLGGKRTLLFLFPDYIICGEPPILLDLKTSIYGVPRLSPRQFSLFLLLSSLGYPVLILLINPFSPEPRLLRVDPEVARDGKIPIKYIKVDKLRKSELGYPSSILRRGNFYVVKIDESVLPDAEEEYRWLKKIVEEAVKDEEVKGILEAMRAYFKGKRDYRGHQQPHRLPAYKSYNLEVKP